MTVKKYETYEHHFAKYGYSFNNKISDDTYISVTSDYVYFHSNNIALESMRRHRLDGPAMIKQHGKKYWYINNKDVTPEITQWASENDIDLDNLTSEDISLIKITWGMSQ